MKKSWCVLWAGKYGSWLLENINAHYNIFLLFHTISVIGHMLATSLYCVSECSIYYGWDRSCGAGAEDILAEQVKFLPHKPALVAAQHASLWYPP